MHRQQSLIWTAGNDKQPTKIFGVWFEPTDRRTAIMGSSSCDMSDTIIHIICSIIQFMTVFLPVCSRCKKVLRSADMLVASLSVTSSWGSNCQAVVDAKRVDTVQGCDYYFTYNTIISLITYIIAIITKKNLQSRPAFIDKTRSKAADIKRD